MSTNNAKPNISEIFASKGAQKLLDASDVLNAVTSSYFITNDQLQIIYYNKAFIDNLDIDTPKEIEGLRPGDILGCIQAHTSENGCGTSKKCQSCNFKNCIVDALNSNQVTSNEVMMTHINNKMVAYRIQATPFMLENSKFVSISSIDITDIKRNQLMESVFFHDLINLSGSLSGYLDIIRDFDPSELSTHISLAKNIADQLLDDIVSQRQIARAEQNRLEADITELSIKFFIQELIEMTGFHPSFQSRNLNIDYGETDFSFNSDSRLLARVLINMLKNANEATAKGNTVSLNVKKEDDSVIFSVHNEEYITPEIRDNIFSFGFSTKGSGRGIGTYSMRLLGENLLGGKLSFTSDEKEGTTFFLKIPANTPISTF